VYFFSCVGGGATGCGVALYAATRGLRVGLVERDAYSAGTSSRSTKLVHEACPWHVPGFILSFEFCIPKSKHHAKFMKQVGKKKIESSCRYLHATGIV
jgi:L-2-hydroxyglutarate oxidase LhgO